MSQSDSEKDTEDLEAQVSQQQQQIHQLQKAVKKMMPGRRGVIKGGAAAAAAGVLGYNSGKAKAAGLNDGDTQWGSDSNRDDYVVDHVDSNSVSTGEIGNAGSPVNITDTVTVDGNSALISVAATGQTTLSSGSATVDTGLSATDATFYLALGIDDPNADAKVTGRLFWDDSAGTYKVEIVEDGTSVGNPTVNYDVLRVR